MSRFIQCKNRVMLTVFLTRRVHTYQNGLRTLCRNDVRSVQEIRWAYVRVRLS